MLCSLATDARRDECAAVTMRQRTVEIFYSEGERLAGSSEIHLAKVWHKSCSMVHMQRPRLKVASTVINCASGLEKPTSCSERINRDDLNLSSRPIWKAQSYLRRRDAGLRLLALCHFYVGLQPFSVTMSVLVCYYQARRRRSAREVRRDLRSGIRFGQVHHQLF